MSRLSSHSVRVNIALGALLLGALTALTACEEDGKTAPERCSPALPIYDIQTGGAREDDGNPCTTDVGHAISSIGTSSTAGTTSGGTTTGGTSSGGTTTADAGAGGAAGGAGGAQ